MKITYAALTSLFLLASDYALARPSTFAERSLICIRRLLALEQFSHGYPLGVN